VRPQNPDALAEISNIAMAPPTAYVALLMAIPSLGELRLLIADFVTSVTDDTPPRTSP
jgi:hypothetical protein